MEDTLSVTMHKEAPAAMILNVTPKTLQDWRLQGIGPAYVKYINKSIRYPADELEKFVEKSRVQTAA